MDFTAKVPASCRAIEKVGTLAAAGQLAFAVHDCNCAIHTQSFHPKRSSLLSRIPLLSLSLAGVLPILVGHSAYAQDLPNGGVIVAGDAHLEVAGSSLNVTQKSERAAIDWQSFSIGAENTVTFSQPSSSSVILNRVVGDEKSIISGALNANGQVFLINSNGLIFNRGAAVNVGGLVASTLDISNEDFMAGNANFVDNGSARSVVNFGTLQAADSGYVALLGNQVQNEGLVVAKLGSAVLAAGDKVSLQFSDDSLVGVTIDQGALDALVENGNAVHADGGLVVLTAKGVDEVLSGVVNNTGEVRARTISEREGRIFLLGDMASGEVNVAGSLDASAPFHGDGGFIETSASRVKINEDAAVSTKSLTAETGEWLIDPTNFVISNDNSGGSSSGIGAVTLSSNLNNTDVIIQTLPVGAEAGNIYVLGDIIKTGAGETSLTLEAHGDIIFNSGSDIVSQGGKLNIYLSANNSQTASEDIIFYSDNQLNTNGGDLMIGGALNNGVPSDLSKVKVIFGKYPDSVQISGYWISQVDFNTPVTLNAGSGKVQVIADKVETNGTVEFNANNVNFDLSNYFYSQSGLSFNADVVNISADNYLYFAGYYPEYNVNTPGHITSSANSYPNATEFNVSSELRFEAVNSIGFEWANINMTGQSDNILSFKSETWGGYGLSTHFEGSPDLTFMLGQKSTEAAAGQSFVSYMNSNSYDVYTAARELKFDYDAFNHFSLDGASYKIQMYSDGVFNLVTPKVFDNGHLAFGNGLSDSITNYYDSSLKNTGGHPRPSVAPGMLGQPFFFDNEFKRWFPFTYSNRPLDVAIGYGGVSSDLWNANGYILRGVDLNNQVSNYSVDYSDFSNGQGIIRASYDLNLVDSNSASVGAVRIENVYELFSGGALMKNTTGIKNLNNVDLTNVRFWVGTSDDWVGNSDKGIKIEGNLVANGSNTIFQTIDDGDSNYTDGNQQARAIVVTEYDPSETWPNPYNGRAVLMYSTNNNAHMVTGDTWDTFADIILDDPLDPQLYYFRGDGAYASFVSLKDIPASEYAAVDWYYGGAKVSAATGFSNIDSLTQMIASDGGLQIFDALSHPYVASAKAAEEARRQAEGGISVERGRKHIPESSLTTERDDNYMLSVNLQSLLNIGYSEVTSFSLSGSARADQSTNFIPLAEAIEFLDVNVEKQIAASDGLSAPFSGDIRIPASRGSLVDIVNGGVRLPDGVDQQIILATNDEE